MKIKEYLSKELGEYKQWNGLSTLMEGGWRLLPVRIEFDLEEDDKEAPDGGSFKDCLGDILQKYKNRYNVSNWSLFTNGNLLVKIRR